MKNKGEITTGIMIVTFIGVIVAMVLLQAVSPFIGQVSQVQTMTNATFTPVNGSWIDLRGQELIGTPIVTNKSVAVVIPATNYTIAERISSVDGLKRIGFYISDGGNAANWSRNPINISYTYGMEGYADDAGARVMTDMIVLLSVIAILMFVLYPILKEKLDF
jgi:hypothetical protein